MSELDGRVVAITGASSGIGAATARALADAGARVALAARRADRLEAVARETGGVAFPTDVADERQARAFIEGASERFGRLDALVNNAGVMRLGPVASADTADWRLMLEVNVLGLLYCTRAALPVMREQGGGHVVNVASVGGRRASPGAAVYNLTKFGVVGFSEALRQEAVDDGVRVTVVEPGFTESELFPGRAPDQPDRILDAADVAEAIRWALSQPEHVAVNEVLVRPAGQRR